MTSPELVTRLRPPAGEPAGALVLLHGRATDENDLFPLLDVLDPQRRLLGITPRGPLSFPPGGAHWYQVRRIGFPDPATFQPTFEALCDWVDALPVEPERLILGGFSQGAVMAYALGLGAGRPRPAGIIALSGFMPTVETLRFDLEARAGLPVAIGHGTYDPVIGVEFGREARTRLTAAGLDVTYRESAMDHSVDPDFLRSLADWMPL